jgi:hypothetical protein
MRAAIYDANTGVITGFAICPDSDVSIQMWANSDWLPVPAGANIAMDTHRVVAGEFVYQEPVPNKGNTEAWTTFRNLRNALLNQCDWTQMADVSLSEDLKIAWQNYRQALRDLPGKTSDPRQPQWPASPTT